MKVGRMGGRVEGVEGGRGGRTGLRRLALAVLLVTFAGVPAESAEAQCRELVLYSRADCPHCARARRFLDDQLAQREDVEVTVLDVGRNPEALQRLRELFAQHGIVAGGVPAFQICGQVIVGFVDEASTGARVLALLDESEVSGQQPRIRAPILGVLEVEELGLPLFTVALGLVDGFNPCAIWVLLILLSVLVNIRDRRKLVVVAGTFVLVSGIAYFIFMAAWLNVFLLIGWSRATQIALGCVAVGVGLIHVKDLVAWGRGPSLSIPDRAKPGIYRRVRRILRAPNLASAVAGAAALAFLVNVIELLCTAGLPAIYTQILTLQPLTRAAYYGYLALYNLAYVFDDAVMVTIAVVTLNHLKLQERAGRWLKGLSGITLIVLGATLLLRPEWLAIGLG